MRLRLGALLFVALAGLAWGCAWDSNTLADELALESGVDTFDLISGQFPHHGDAFYEAQLERGRAALSKDPSDWTARNDAAVALMKLGRFEESQTELEAQLEEDPQRYETLSNLGVLHKKMGQFATAADYIARALAIKPEGHMGLGDWYLRMLRYQASLADGVPEQNFLGLDYGDGSYRYPPELFGLDPEARNRDIEASLSTRIQSMIRNDRAFPDSYMVLGDVLSMRQPSLALWAYVRAKQLGHPNAAAVETAIANTFSNLRSHAKHDGSSMHYVGKPEEVVGLIVADLEQAQSWLAGFQKVEAERLAAGQPTDFASVLSALEAAGVERLHPAGHAVRSGVRGLFSNPQHLLLIGLGALVLMIYIGARTAFLRIRRAHATA